MEPNPALSESEVRQIEEKYGFTVPLEYRWFITSIGNGGAGPFYGIFPLGEHDDGYDLNSWECGGLIGDLGQPFPHTEAWNLPAAFWSEQPSPGDKMSDEEWEQQYEAWNDKLEEKYWGPAIMQGAIPICHEGCALRDWLVVSGPLDGTMWRDMRADNGGWRH
ncbi:SMI1/KNR4 family protein [Pseudoduganella violaceinigra]|uniref:SMI1/KNR4 family protein n=1 Tax=Pseudoduganella violaceinigra TaxID=246602 RepID=UPI0012B527D0|nr:SMI1/KNR4 family protein [Pseudoduganella violaceinigra]